jgi:uncharacterized repeat protein (TIGR01451 family)
MNKAFMATSAAGIGLLLTIEPAPGAVLYQAIDLGTMNGAFRSEARNISESGLVWCINNHTDVPAFTWSNGITTAIARPPEVATLGLYQMNDAGKFAGSFSYFTSKPATTFFGTPTWPMPLATNFAARGLNLAGQVAGFTTVRVESPPGSGIFFTVNRPAVVVGRKLTRLPSLLGDEAPVNADGVAINDSGMVIGASGTTNNAAHAFLWDGAIRDLHTLTTRSNSVAVAINQNGSVVGYIYDFSTFRYPFIWTPSDGMNALNLLPGYTTGQPLGLNERGEIVGVAGTSAVIWSNGVMTDLQTVIPTSPAWDLDGAYDINNNGEIVGYGKNGGLTKAFLLRPTNIPPAQFNVELLDPADPGIVSALTGVSVTPDYSVLETLSAVRDGVTADGASRLVIRVSATNHGTVKLSLRAADGASGVSGNPWEDGHIGSMGSTAGSDQYTLATTSTATGQRAYALYHAPEIFHRNAVDSDLPLRLVGMRVVFTPDSGSATTQAVSIHIVRPPVVLMHGIWSSRQEAFEGFEEAFKQNEAVAQVFGPSYPNDLYFRSNATVLPDEIAHACAAFRQQGFAATRADVFSHSMGGVLSRIYAGSANYKRSENYQRGDINRLVTINSPHRGSFVADIQDGLFPWLSQTAWGRSQRDAIEFLMRDMGKSVTAGASYDLSSTSAEIVKMNQRPTDVAAHVIIGDFEIVADYTQYPPPFGAIYRLFYEIPGFDYTPVRFQVPVDHDFLVSVDSQGAGLLTPPPNFSPSTVYGHHHAGAANTTNVMVRSLFLYRQRPGSAWYWQGFPTGWTPPNQSPPPPPPVTGPTGTNYNLVLLASANVAPGQQVQCSATPPGGVNFASVAFLTPDAYVEDTNAPFSATLTIPTVAVGEYLLSYLARDADSNVWWGTQLLTVTPASPPNFLDAEPRRFIFTQLGTTRQITVAGTYAGSVERNLTAPASGTTYTSADTNIVSVNTNGVMMAMGQGATVVAITNGSRFAFVDVQVTSALRTDLVLTKTVSASNLFAGQPVTFTLRVTNAGPQTAHGVYLADTLPPGAQFHAATASQGAWFFSGGAFTVEFGSLAPGSEVVATFTVSFSLGGELMNEATVSAVGADTRDADNSVIAVLNVIALPVLGIRREGAQIILSWLTNTAGFELERTTALVTSPVWEPAATIPPVVGDHFELVLSPTNAPAFFRLRLQ